MQRKKADPNFQEKIENKKTKYQDLALKLKEKSSLLFNQSITMSKMIPMGQPIHIGHHSEKSDRAFRKKIDNKMRQGSETKKKADYYENKAENFGTSKIISSADPDAFLKLENKIKMLENYVNNCKEANKILRKLTTWEMFDQWIEETFKNDQSFINKLVKEKAEYCRDRMYQVKSPSIYGYSFELTNSNAEIRRLKKRLESLKDFEEREAFNFKNEMLEAKEEKGRINIYFESKPSEDIRTKLNAKGFKWSPTRTAWTKQITSSTPKWFISSLPEFLGAL
ncbi:MAG: DUF3560 domain-containing protein [Methanobacterium sp.]